MIRPRIQRHRCLYPRTISAAGNPLGPRRSRHLTAGGAYQLMPLILSDHRLDRRHLAHLMPPWLGIVSRQGCLAVCTLLGLDHHHLIDFVHRQKGAGMTRMTRLATTAALTPRPTWTFVMGWVAR